MSNSPSECGPRYASDAPPSVPPESASAALTHVPDEFHFVSVAGPSQDNSSWLHGVEVLVKHAGELSAVSLPVPSRGVILQTCDPIAVELVNDGVNTTQLPPDSQGCARARIKTRYGAFGSPTRMISSSRPSTVLPMGAICTSGFPRMEARSFSRSERR